jgi:hypothetical protein
MIPYSFFDELEKIAAQFSMPVAEPQGGHRAGMQPLPAGNMPIPSPPAMKPPKPPISEKVKTLANKGGAALKMIENVVTAPQKPHRYLGVSYKKDFSGFKYS